MSQGTSLRERLSRLARTPIYPTHDVADFSQLLRRLGVLVLAAAVIGLPINHIAAYFGFVLVVIVTFCGCVLPQPKRWLLAAAVASIAVLLQVVVSPPRIEEGHNVFLLDEERPIEALSKGLPAGAYRFMAAEFASVYPAEKHCARTETGCWRRAKQPERAFAFSNDSILDRALYSRRVTGIDFSDATWLRLGFINNGDLDWWDDRSDIVRGTKVAKRHRFDSGWDLLLPWYVMYQFPAAYAGSSLCWRGTVLWEGPNEQFAPVTNTSIQCRAIADDDIGRRIFGVAVRHKPALAMKLEPAFGVRARQVATIGIALFGAILALTILVRTRPRDIVAPVFLVAWATIVLFNQHPALLGGLPPQYAGNDGFTHEGFGHRIVLDLLRGDIVAALRGGESVYYFVPGLRYLRAVEKIIFGDTNFLYLSILLALPLVVFGICRHFLGGAWALVATLFFMASWRGGITGLSFKSYAAWVSPIGFADTAGAFALLAGLLATVAAARTKSRSIEFWPGFGAALLLALAVLLRPNLFPPALCIAAGAILSSLLQAQYARAGGLLAGFAAISLMAIHNYAFGGVFVPFTSGSRLPELYVMPPAAYAAALSELAALNIGDNVVAAHKHINNWLRSPYPRPAFTAVHVLAIAATLHILCGRRHDLLIRATALAALSGQAVALIYVATPRYHLATLSLTFLILLFWLRNEAWPAARAIALRRRARGASSPPDER